MKSFRGLIAVLIACFSFSAFSAPVVVTSRGVAGYMYVPANSGVGGGSGAATAPVEVVGTQELGRQCFTSSGVHSASIPAGTTTIQYVIVGGGGGGGAGVYSPYTGYAGGGGGAGYINYGSMRYSSGVVTVTVGDGGLGARNVTVGSGAPGGDSSLFYGASTVTAKGGSGGYGYLNGVDQNYGGAGGSGGGRGGSYTVGGSVGSGQSAGSGTGGAGYLDSASAGGNCNHNSSSGWCTPGAGGGANGGNGGGAVVVSTKNGSSYRGYGSGAGFNTSSLVAGKGGESSSGIVGPSGNLGAAVIGFENVVLCPSPNESQGIGAGAGGSGGNPNVKGTSSMQFAGSAGLPGAVFLRYLK